jgi:hypothetical protein
MVALIQGNRFKPVTKFVPRNDSIFISFFWFLTFLFYL